MSERPTRLGGLGIGADQVFGVVNDVQKQLDAISLQLQSDSFIGVGLPEVDSSFTPLYEVFKRGIKVTLAYFIPGYATSLKTIIVNDSEMVDADAYAHSRIKDTFDDITDEDRALGRIERRFEDPLEPNTTYRVIRLNAFDINGNPHYNPESEPDFAGYSGNVLFSFTTPAGANAPSKPTLARIIRNEVDTTADGFVPLVTVRVFADETETLTFAQQLTDSIQVKFEQSDDATVDHRRAVRVENPAATFIDIEVGDLFFVGRVYNWIHCLAWSLNETATAPATSTIQFVAGGFADPSDLTDLTLVSYVAELTDEATELNIILTINQPDPAFKLRNCTVRRKRSGRPDTDYDLPENLVASRIDLRDPIYNVPGDIEIEFPMTVNPARTYVIRTTVRVVGDFTKNFTSGDITGAGLVVPARETAAGGGPSLLDGGALVASVKDYQDYQNTLDGSGAGAAGDADFPGKNWQTTANSGTRINNRATGVGGSTLDSVGIRWMNADKRLLLATDIFTKGGKPAARLGKLFRANDQVVICPLFLSSSGNVTITFIVALVDQVSGDMATVSIPMVISATEASRGMGILVVSSSYSGTAKQWLEFRPQSNPSQNIYLWNTHLDWGIFYRDFKVNSDEQAVLTYLDASPTSAGSGAGNIITEDEQGNQYSPDGTPGGQIFLT